MKKQNGRSEIDGWMDGFSVHNVYMPTCLFACPSRKNKKASEKESREGMP